MLNLQSESGNQKDGWTDPEGSVGRVKDILDEIRAKDMILGRGEEGKARGQDRNTLRCRCRGRRENRVEGAADSVQLLVAEIIVGDGVEKKQKKEQADGPVTDFSAFFH
jgi:hypothetical protein